MTRLASLYIDLVFMALPAAARRHLEDLMATTVHKYGSSFARGFYDEGQAEGEVIGQAKAVLNVLDARGIDVPEGVQNEIVACTDLDQINIWLRRALTVVTVEDLFD